MNNEERQQIKEQLLREKIEPIFRRHFKEKKFTFSLLMSADNLAHLQVQEKGMDINKMNYSLEAFALELNKNKLFYSLYPELVVFSIVFNFDKQIENMKTADRRKGIISEFLNDNENE